ncbi:MAG: hypothetical protein COB60_06365 [Flavobacteriaceae bacterium]|nr:MAG: hypothetical protein COB60_06365 [Flavobacteriaceae bacterium]
MKNLFLTLVLFLTVSFAFAVNNTEKVSSTFNIEETLEFTNSSKLSYEYKAVIIDGNVGTCYVRVCWNESETKRKCTEWQEVPCNTELELEGNKIK